MTALFLKVGGHGGGGDGDSYYTEVNLMTLGKFRKRNSTLEYSEPKIVWKQVGVSLMQHSD